MSYLKHLDIGINTTLKDPDEDALSRISLNRVQVVSLEKMIIELKAMQQDVEKLVNELS